MTFQPLQVALLKKVQMEPLEERGLVVVALLYFVRWHNHAETTKMANILITFIYEVAQKSSERAHARRK